MFKVKRKRPGHSDCIAEYLLNGQLHREDGPAIEWSDGSKFWYINGKQHRDDGPAVECRSHVSWFKNGVRIRVSEDNNVQSKSKNS